eukprot:2500143-Rhodomonas_salina.4
MLGTIATPTSPSRTCPLASSRMLDGFTLRWRMHGLLLPGSPAWRYSSAFATLTATLTRSIQRSGVGSCPSLPEIS